MDKRHKNTEIPKKRSKKNPLTKEDKKENRKISASRVLVENVIRCLKIFRILSEKYRNRRKRYGLRLNLIAALYNFQLWKKSNIFFARDFFLFHPERSGNVVGVNPAHHLILKIMVQDNQVVYPCQSFKQKNYQAVNFSTQ